jgi:hypothetical protein
MNFCTLRSIFLIYFTLAYFYCSFYKIYLVIVYYVVRSGLKAEKAEKAEKGMKAVLQKKISSMGRHI